MYGAPGPGYQGHNEQLTNGIDETGKLDPVLKVGPHPTNTASTARLIYPEYMCFFPTIFLRGAGACEVDCPEDVRENAKCQRNGWIWAERVVELRTERAEREREKVNKNKKETEGLEENDGR